MKFWLFVGIIFTVSVGYKLQQGDELGARISESRTKLLSYHSRNVQPVMASEKALQDIATASYESQQERINNEKQAAIQTFYEKLSNIPQECDKTKALLSIRFENAKLEDNVTRSKVNKWVDYAYTKCREPRRIIRPNKKTPSPLT